MKHPGKIFTVCLALAGGTVAFAADPAPAEQEMLKIFNLAQAAQAAGEHAAALQGFLRVKQSYPDDVRVRAKVIQEYAALGKAQELDAEVKALYAFHAGLTKEAQQKFAFFCREQFSAGQRKVLVHEHFELEGVHAIKYAFTVFDATGQKRDFTLSLGPADSATEAARAVGSLGRQERLFHLDGYYADGEHRAYGFFEGEPKYEVVKQQVVQILEGTWKPLSDTRPATNDAPVTLPTK